MAMSHYSLRCWHREGSLRYSFTLFLLNFWDSSTSSIIKFYFVWVPLPSVVISREKAWAFFFLGSLPGHAFPAWRTLSYNGVLSTFSYRSATDRGNWCGPSGGMDRPSHIKSNPAGSLSSSQTGGPPCWASPLAFIIRTLLNLSLSSKHIML